MLVARGTRVGNRSAPVQCQPPDAICENVPNDQKSRAVATGRVARLASMARAGLGTATSMLMGSSGGIEKAVNRLGELRGLGTKVGQMAGLVEANLPPDVRARVGPALARLRAHAVSSPYAEVARIVEEDLGAPPEVLFRRFDREPFASASLGQVHDAVHPNGARVAVKIQHPGIRDAFAADLANATSLASVATSFFMPDGQGRPFIDGLKDGFLAELDYVREANNTRLFGDLFARDPDLELPLVQDDRSSARVLTTTFLRGVPVEGARSFDESTRRRQAAAVRRFVLSALADHGLLYADAHAGNFFFRPDGTVGVLDFGSVFQFGEEQRRSFADFLDALGRADRPAFGACVGRAFRIDNRAAAEAIADVQWIAVGGLVRGEPISDVHVRRITQTAATMKSRLLREKVALPFYMPFFMRTMLACNALLAALDAPESGVLERHPPTRKPSTSSIIQRTP
jgi:predicted unusual protein kinase regulating ubiquinone biosynthesis (AarF/ABC1/UbiB family)